MSTVSSVTYEFSIQLKMAASESEPSLEITCDSTILAIPGTTQLVPSMSEPFPEATTTISSPVTNTFQMGRYTLHSNWIDGNTRYFQWLKMFTDLRCI